MFLTFVLKSKNNYKFYYLKEIDCIFSRVVSTGRKKNLKIGFDHFDDI